MRDRLSWLTRFFGQFRLWQQFVLLGLFVVTVPIISTTIKFLNDGATILTEHEIIDLSDEANLRVDEIRQDFERMIQELAAEARTMAKDLPDPAAGPIVNSPVVEESLKQWSREWPTQWLAPGQVPQTVSQVRFRYFRNTLDLATVVSLKPALQWGPLVGVGGERLPANRTLDPVERDAVEELVARVQRKVPAFLSGLHLQPRGEGLPPRCLIAVAWPIRWNNREPVDLFVVLLDFTEYIRNRARTSPRHHYIVTSARGELLVHPKSEYVRQSTRIAEITDWPFATQAWLPSEESQSERDQRHASMVQSGGMRLPGVEVPALRHYYTKGYFGGEVAKLLGDRANDALAELNGTLDQIAREDELFRFDEVNLNSSYIELSHPLTKVLEARQKQVTEWWDRVRQKQGTRVDWSRPLKCETFQGQLTHLRLDLGDQDEPPRLIIAASLEELRQDIDTRFTRIVWSWVIPTVAVATAFTLLLIVLLTRSLQKLARTATTLSDPAAFAALTSSSCKEVEELQSALRGMATRLNDDAARYSTILRTAGEGILVTNLRGVIEVANRAAGEMFGYESAERLTGVSVQTLLEDRLDDQLIHLSNAESTTREELRGRRKDGSLIWLEVTTRPVSLKDRMIVTCIIRDISQRRAAEEQIKKMNEELELRVRLRTAELAETNTKLEVALKEAEAASKAKDAFVANMSHELRQPLHIIIGFTEALREEATDDERTELVADLNKILTAAKHLLELINDILDLAKIAAGRMELNINRFPVSKLLDEVKTLVSPLADRNNNRFTLATSDNIGEMLADERRVKQMLINLLSNAFKFTTQGQVTLSAERIVQQGHDWIRFGVKDTGKGMSPEQVKRLFQRFYQADASTTREAGGTGLGLAITQSFNELMKGLPIEITSEVGQGSEFVLWLPADVQTAPRTKTSPRLTSFRTMSDTPAQLPSPSPAGGGEVVLVIDDDPMVQELMKRFLVKEGFQVVTASSGAEGLRLASELKPIAITLDVMMPGTDGWTVLSSLKLNADTCDIPVVMLTIVDDRGRGYALGAADYLTKPIDWQRLGTILKRYLPQDRHAPVLVIDDDPECRDIVQRYLEREGWRIVCAENGEAGLLAYAQEAPALILLDLMMPQLDGFGFLDELARRFPASQTPVIVLTAKELTAEDFDRLNGRVAKILEKSNFEHLDDVLRFVRRHARHQGATDGEVTHRG